MPNFTAVKSLWVCQSTSVAQGFALTNWILRRNINSDLARVLESSILPQGGFLILVEGTAEALQSIHDQAHAEHILKTFKTLLIESLQPDVVPAFYSLQNDVPENFSLLICECASVIDAFVTANEAARFDSSLRIIDLRAGRGTGGIPLVFIAGPAAQVQGWNSEMDDRRLGDPHARVFIEKPHPQFTELFV